MISLKLTPEQKYTSFGLVAVVIWSFAALLATEIIAIPIFELMFFQFTLAFIVTMFRYFRTSDKGAFFNFSKRDFIVASLALIVSQACYLSAFRYSPAAQVDLINYLWPTMLILLSSLLPKEKFCAAYLFSCIVCLWGINKLVPWNDGLDLPYDSIFGLILAFGSASSWALYSLYTRYHKSSSANCISFAFGLVAIGSLVLHLQKEVFVFPNYFEGLIIILMGVTQMGLAFYLWECSLKKGRIKVLSLASQAIPVLSILILVIFGKATFDQNILTATLAISFAPIIPLVKNLMEQFQKQELYRS
jgi:drug/metabolite transporter (DMT)-like permease